MRALRTGPGAYTVEFEEEATLRAEYQANLSVGGLRLPSDEVLEPFALVTITLRLVGGGEATIPARVVGVLPGALALALEGAPGDLLERLLAAPAAAEPEDDDSDEPAGTLWERLRALNRNQRIFLAAKANRSERALLLQDNDAQVLFSLLKNPRLSLDEVVRVAKSSFLSFQMVELILKTSQWIANLDVRLALVHNPKTPVPFALRLLPTLPDSEVRLIAKGAATSMALKQAALRRVQGAG